MNWYKANNAKDSQGLVIEEETGRNVAVTYDPKDAAKVAAMPELLDVLKEVEGMCNMPEVRQAMMKHEQAYYHKIMNAVRAAIRKAEGE